MCLQTQFQQSSQNRFKCPHLRFETFFCFDAPRKRELCNQLIHRRLFSPQITDQEPQTVKLPSRLCKTSRYFAFLHTFRRVESTYFRRRKIKRRLWRWQTQRFPTLFCHFETCAKTAKRKRNAIVPDKLTISQINNFTHPTQKFSIFYFEF